MLPYRDSRVTRILLIVFFVAALGYAYYAAQSMLWGPRIELEASGPITSTEQLVIVKGQADSIRELRINGKPVAVTEEGAFEEPYLLAPGFNRIVLEARDRYGRVEEQALEIAHIPQEPTAATTTEDEDVANSE